MADLVITANNVIAGANAKTERYIAGEALTAGQTVYQAADGKIYKSDADSATPAQRAVIGISLNGAAAGQPVGVALSGPVTIGAAVTVGVGYYLSKTVGGICPVADLTAGSYPTFLGFAINVTDINISLVSAGVSL